MTAVDTFLERIESGEPTPGLDDAIRRIRTSERPLTKQCLSPRERLTTILIACGLTNDQIAKRMVISVKTVEKHRASAYKFYGVHNAAALTIRALEAGFIKLPEAIQYLNAARDQK